MTPPDSLSNAVSLESLPRLPQDDGGPVFAEPWQANAFALAVKLSEQGYFTWKEWAAALADDLKGAANRGEPDDGSRYYDHWLSTLERLVVAKGLTTEDTLAARKQAWTQAYRATPHGVPVELPHSFGRGHAAWIVLGLTSTIAAYVFLRQSPTTPAGAWQIGVTASAGLGSLLGVRHALEPDHLAAVATLVTGERSSAKAAWLGACWGLGHTLTLLAAGVTLVLLRADMPPLASHAFELGVSLLLVGFGVRAMYQGARGRPRGHTHKGGTSRSPITTGRFTIARRPLLVGAMHGLAGSGAMTAFVVATLPSTPARLGYLALFGLGSIVGMTALSGVLGWPIARLGANRSVVRTVSLIVGGASTGLGLWWSYPLIFRLF